MWVLQMIRHGDIQHLEAAYIPIKMGSKIQYFKSESNEPLE